MICHRSATRKWKKENKDKQKAYQEKYLNKNANAKSLSEKVYRDKKRQWQIESTLSKSLSSELDISKAINFKKQFFANKHQELRTVI